MIAIRNVIYKAGGATILDDISVDIDRRSVAIIGRNGSGKSTFARLLNGLILPDSGDVQIHGLNTAGSRREVRRKVGFVFQNPDLQFVFPTVEEDLMFGLKNIGLAETEIESRIDTTLADLGMQELRQQSVHSLSGGEKQLICIAAVVVMQPETIVFDEPATLLDLANRRLINRTILQLPGRKVIVTHDLDFAQQVEEVLVIDAGKVVFQGTPADATEHYLSIVDNR